MKFDDALQIVGEIGRYQISKVIPLSMVIFTTGVQIMITVFTLNIPDHRCAAPGVDKDVYSNESHVQGDLVAGIGQPTSSSDLNQVGPSSVQYALTQCHVRLTGIRNLSQLVDIAPHMLPTKHNWLTEEDIDGSNNSISISCGRWVYDQSVFTSTLATQMNFVCDDKILVSHALMMLMVGQMLGSLFGSAADISGRKKLMVVCLFFHFVSSVLITVVGNIYSLGTVYLINGFALATAYCCSFTLIMEQVGLRWRHVVGIGCTAVWGIGMLFVGMLSYFLRDWRHLQLAASLPAVFFVFFTCLIPESARWLAESGRYTEAEDILERMARGNGKQLTSKIQLRTESQGEEPHQKAQSLTMLLRCPPLLLRLAVVLFNWFTCSLTYYGLSMNVGQLSGNIHLNFCLSALFELVGFTSAILLLYKVGRKKLYCCSLLLGAVACLLTVIPVIVNSVGSSWAVRALSMVGKLGVTTAFAIVWLFTPELFPTPLRAGVTGASSCSARIGGVAASYLATLTLEGQVGSLLPQIVFGGVGLVAGLSALMLPETKQAGLPDSIEDAIQMKRRKPKDTSLGHQNSLVTF